MGSDAGNGFDMSQSGPDCRAGTAMELNTSGLNAECGEVYPNKPMLGEMLKRNIPVVLVPMPMIPVEWQPISKMLSIS